MSTTETRVADAIAEFFADMLELVDYPVISPTGRRVSVIQCFADNIAQFEEIVGENEWVDLSGPVEQARARLKAKRDHDAHPVLFDEVSSR